MDAWYMLVLAGVVCGVFSALFGVGSGIIMVPLLVLALHLPQKVAQGMSLAIMVPMALTGAIRYRMNPAAEMNMAAVLFLAAGGVAGAWLGVCLVGRMPDTILRRSFAVVMVVAAVRLFLVPGQGRDAATKAAHEAHASQGGAAAEPSDPNRGAGAPSAPE